MHLHNIIFQAHAENQLVANEAMKLEETSSTDHIPLSEGRSSISESIVMESVNLKTSTLWSTSQRRHSFTEGDEKLIINSMTSTSDSDDCYSDLAELMSHNLTVPSTPWSSSQRRPHSFSEGNEKLIIEASIAKR